MSKTPDPKVENWQVTLSQEADGCAPDQNDQFLELSSHDAGGGAYYVIKTERWAFDNAEELIEAIKRAFKKEFNHG